MRFLSTFSLLLSVASADQVSLSFTLDAGKNMSSVIVYSSRGGALIGRCGRIIDTKVAIDFSKVTVNDKGARSPYGNYITKGLSLIPITSGNFTVGNDTYAIHPDRVYSGGPSCKTDVDSFTNRISVYCIKLWWDYTDIMDDPITVATDCFGDFPPVRGQHETDYYTKEQKEDFRKKSLMAPNSIIGRRCKKGGPYGVGLDGIGQLGGATFGFSVTNAWSTGNSHICGGNPGDRVCVWYKVAHTAYTVRKEIGGKKRGKCKMHDKQDVVAAPNIGNNGGGFICKHNNECKSMGERYWDCYGRHDLLLKYCPPPGHPSKLHMDKGYLPQCLEEEAVRQDEKKKKKSMTKKEWKNYNKRKKEEYKRLKKDHEERTKDEKEREEEEEKNMREREKQAGKSKS
ncbi:hypothetical protein FGLOB1_14482 [Fusarium globosum]|uniref:Uncharacterized protein n=1 Tax=Fusarium globosum TaxID=78864 RepID=A0A8H5XFU1_9HYPO|nr:hypothetical protein FGLOB1_14482 [Fusarium globosum]